MAEQAPESLVVLARLKTFGKILNSEKNLKIFGGVRNSRENNSHSAQQMVPVYIPRGKDEKSSKNYILVQVQRQKF